MVANLMISFRDSFATSSPHNRALWRSQKFSMGLAKKFSINWAQHSGVARNSQWAQPPEAIGV